MIIVHIHLIDPRHGADGLQGTLEHPPVVLQHGIIKCAFHDGTDMIAVLPDGRVEHLHIHRPENDIEQNEQEDQGSGGDEYHTSIDGRPDPYEFPDMLPGGDPYKTAVFA